MIFKKSQDEYNSNVHLAGDKQAILHTNTVLWISLLSLFCNFSQSISSSSSESSNYPLSWNFLR